MSRKPRSCAVCPKFEKGGWCLHLATMRPPDAPSCEYGRKMMNSRNATEYNRKKYGWKKRPKKPHVEEEE